ncbi:MAG: hypothetical protein ABSH33_20865 [Steroidobacteraceae bacterium]|jgi:hypothetical protein
MDGADRSQAAQHASAFNDGERSEVNNYGFNDILTLGRLNIQQLADRREPVAERSIE